MIIKQSPLISWIPRAVTGLAGYYFLDWSCGYHARLRNATILLLTVLIVFPPKWTAYRWFSTKAWCCCRRVGSSFSEYLVDRCRACWASSFGYVAKRLVLFSTLSSACITSWPLLNMPWVMAVGLAFRFETHWKRGYLPEAHTDFVFDCYWGSFDFFGATLVLALLFSWFYELFS